MIDLLIFWRGYIQHVIILALFLSALRFGGAPEKLAAGILVGMVVLDYLYVFFFPQATAYASIDLGVAINDFLVLVALSLLAMRANRIYPLCMLGAQLIATLMHLNREILPGMDGIAYVLLTRAPSYIQIVALGLGLLAHRRRIRRFGTYRSWRHS